MKAATMSSKRERGRERGRARQQRHEAMTIPEAAFQDAVREQNLASCLALCVVVVTGLGFGVWLRSVL